MAGKILFAILVLCVAATIEASSLLSFGRSLRSNQNVASTRDTAPAFQTLTQYRDHFDVQDQSTFSQRYVVNAQYWDGTGPVFFMLGFESQLDPNTVVEEGGFIFVQWAKHFNALLLSLETRYYGESIPNVTDYSTPNLRWLNDDQILADAALFRQYISGMYNAQHNKWFTFGGSYGGMLAGWMRIKYPHLIYASVASSAVVKAQNGNPQFIEVVTDVLEAFGGKSCVDNIATASRQVQHDLKTEEGREFLSEYFDTCQTIQPQDETYFLLTFAGNMFFIVQDYGLVAGIPTPTDVCNIMNNQSNTPLENYRTLYIQVFNGGFCSFIDTNAIHAMGNGTDIATALANSRGYIYQMCYEFGYQQTSNTVHQPFGPFNPVEAKNEACYSKFGLNVTQADFDKTNRDFGGKHPGGSRILWVSGSIDPWYPLCITRTPPGAEWETLFIDGTSHIADMYVPTSVAPPTLAPAQAVIKHQLGRWIRE